MKISASRPAIALAAPGTTRGAARATHRPASVAQRQLQQAIATSPRQAAQRQWASSLAGQRKPAGPTRQAPAALGAGRPPLQAVWDKSAYKQGDKFFGPRPLYCHAPLTLARSLSRADYPSSDWDDGNNVVAAATWNLGISVTKLQGRNADINTYHENTPYKQERDDFTTFYDSDWSVAKHRRQAKYEESVSMGNGPDERGFARVSKAALEYTFKRGNTIHFIQGEESYVEKAANKDTARNPTAREMRYIFRNWDRMKHSVKFYSDIEGTVVAAPWESNTPAVREAWQQYAERRASKLKS